MTKEDKELLLKDLSGRISYGVIIEGLDKPELLTIKTLAINMTMSNNLYRPYLRPMSSMTRQECTQLNILLPRYFIVTPECLACLDHINGGIINFEVLDTIIEFYNSHHLDWRGLIPKGLALEAPKDMYK